MAGPGKLAAVPPSMVDSYAACSVLLYDSAGDIRRHTRGMLAELGFGRIADTGDFQTFRDAVAANRYDLIICEAGDPPKDASRVVRNVRQRGVGGDPFLGVILTTAVASGETVRRAVNSGTDHLLAKPYAPSQVAKRIRAIVESRKPFVVTIDYVGPDRRNADRSPRNVERITVPNALRAKVRRDPEAAASPAAIESALKRITRARALSFDLGIGILIALIVDGGKRERPARALVRLHKVGKLVSELQNVVMRGDFVDALPSCASLSKLVRELVESGGEIARGARQTLEEQAMALHLCFNPEKTVSAIGAEIDTAVERFRRHNREQPA